MDVFWPWHHHTEPLSTWERFRVQRRRQEEGGCWPGGNQQVVVPYNITFDPGAEPDVWHVQTYFCIVSIIWYEIRAKSQSFTFPCQEKFGLYTLSSVSFKIFLSLNIGIGGQGLGHAFHAAESDILLRYLFQASDLSHGWEEMCSKCLYDGILLYTKSCTFTERTNPVFYFLFFPKSLLPGCKSWKLAIGVLSVQPSVALAHGEGICSLS